MWMFTKLTSTGEGEQKAEDDVVQSSKNLVHVDLGWTLQPTNQNRLTVPSQAFQSCIIEIRNHHKDLQLVSPSYFLFSGMNQAPPPPIIAPGQAEACLFCKKPASAWGSTGVLTYNIIRVSEKLATPKNSKGFEVDTGMTLALLYSIPVFETSVQGIGIKKQGQTDHRLCDEMLYSNQPWFVRINSGSQLRFETVVDGISITILASMSSSKQAIWTIDIC